MTRTRRARREQGQATVELALLLPIVAVVALLAVQVALVVRAQLLTVEAARAAARAAAVDDRPDAARAAAATAGLRPADLTVTTERDRSSRRVRVVVSYRVRTDVSLIGPALPDVTVHADATMRTERTPAP